MERNIISSELDRLISDSEFQKQQLLKLIEHEGYLINALTCEAESKEDEIKRLNQRDSEATNNLKHCRKQFAINIDNFDSLKKTSQVLNDHVDAMTTKRDDTLKKIKIEKEGNDTYLQKYEDTWQRYKTKYEAMPIAIELQRQRSINAGVAEKNEENTRMITALRTKIQTISEGGNSLYKLSTTEFIVKIVKMRQECISLHQTNQPMKNVTKQNDENKMVTSSESPSEEQVHDLNISRMEIHDEDNSNEDCRNSNGEIDKRYPDKGNNEMCNTHDDINIAEEYDVNAKNNSVDVEMEDDYNDAGRGNSTVKMIESNDKLSNMSKDSIPPEHKIPQLSNQRVKDERAQSVKESECHQTRNVTKPEVLEPPLIARPLHRSSVSMQQTSLLVQPVPHSAPQSMNSSQINFPKWVTPVVSQPSCTKVVMLQLTAPRYQDGKQHSQQSQTLSRQISQMQLSTSSTLDGNTEKLHRSAMEQKQYSFKPVPKLQLSVEKLSCQKEQRNLPFVRNTTKIQTNEVRIQSLHVPCMNQGMNISSKNCPSLNSTQENDNFSDNKPTEQTTVPTQQKSKLKVPALPQFVPKTQQPTTVNQQTARKPCPSVSQPPISVFKEAKPVQDPLAKEQSIKHTNFKKLFQSMPAPVQVQNSAQPQPEGYQVMKTVPILQQIHEKEAQVDSNIVASPENFCQNEPVPVSDSTVQDQVQSIDESQDLSEVKMSHPESSPEKAKDEGIVIDEVVQEDMDQTDESVTYFLPMKECQENDDKKIEDKLSQDSAKSPVDLNRRRKHLEELFSKSPGLPDNYLAPLKRPFAKGDENHQKLDNDEIPAFGMSQLQETSIFSSGDADTSMKPVGSMLHKSGIQESKCFGMFGINASPDGSKETSFAFFNQNKQTTDDDSFFNFGKDSQNDKQESNFSSMFDFGKLSNSPQKESAFKMSIFDQSNDSQSNDNKFSFNFGQNSPAGNKLTTDNNNVMSMFGGESGDDSNNKDGFFMLNFGSNQSDSPATKPFSFF